MTAESDATLQHTLFSDHKQFEAQFTRDLRFSLISPNNYAGIFYTLMGYFSTIHGMDLSDQVTSELIKTHNILIAGQNYDRFYVLLIAKTVVSKRLTGRLFYFHLNENSPPLTDHFSWTDIDIIYHQLKLPNSRLGKATLLKQWIQHIENNLLCVKIKGAQLGSNANEQLDEKDLVVDATFYRAVNLFGQNRRHTTVWRELKITNLIIKTQKQQFFRKSTPTYNDLFLTFMRNSRLDTNEEIVKFSLSKENFLYFVYGALQYNYKQLHSIKITPIYAGSYLEKLAVLEYDQKKWVTDSSPIIFQAYESFNDISDIQTAPGIDLPIDFLSNSKFALINTIFFGQTNNIEGAKFLTEQAQIDGKTGLIHFLNQIIKLERDEYYGNFFEIRKQLLMQLSRIDTFLGHQHKTSILRHYIFAAIMTIGLKNPAYKLKHRFDEMNPVDIFLIQSSDSSGIVVSMSKNIVSETIADPIADILMNTGLKKLLVLTINDQTYEHLVDMESEMNPLLDMWIQDSITHGQIDFDPSHWSIISPVLSDNYFSKMMINQQKQRFRSSMLQTELTSHSMWPNTLWEFEAQMKGFAAGKQIFTPYGYDHILIGIKVDRSASVEEMNRFRIPVSCGDSRRPFHIIFQLKPNEYNPDLNHLKNFFKKQLPSSNWEKINTGLIRPRILRETDNSIKYEFDGSFPNGVDAHEYAECLPRNKRAGYQTCLLVEEEKDNPELVFKHEHTAKTSHTVESISKFVNKAIYLQMIKGIIGSAMDGDFKRMAKESGILAGMVGVGAAGDVAVQWGRSLLKKNNLLKGGGAYLGGKLLSKAYLGFVIADLVSRSKAYQMGDKDQLVGIVGDTAILTINVIPLTLEIYSTFVSIEEASVELGPEVMIAEAIIFAAIDSFYAVRSVQKINEKLQLSWGEDFVQWTKSFFGARTLYYLEDLEQEKDLLQKTVDDATKKLELQKNRFTYYATPTLKINRKGNIVPQEDNVIDMNSKTQVWSRTWPKTRQNLHVECASSGNEKKASTMSWSRKISDNLGITTDGSLYESYFCENMITLKREGKNQTDDSALIALGYGNDTANGFRKKKNYFIIGAGKKQITGGELGDVFHFIGNDAVYGSIDGGEGENTLDLSQYLLTTELLIDLENETLAYPMNTTIIVKGVGNVIGRSGSVDQVICSCKTRYLDLKGGESNVLSDVILVPRLNCTSELTIKLSGYVNIQNRANKASFIYLVTENTNATISNMFDDTTYQYKDVFFLPMNLSLVDSIESISMNNKISMTLKSQIYNTTVILNGNHENSNLIFADEYQMSYYDSMFHARREVQHYTFDDKGLRENLLMISQKLNITVTVFSKVNNRLIQAHNMGKPQSSIENKGSVTHFSNDPDYKSTILTTNYVENYFQINAVCDKNFTTIKCWMKNLSIHILSLDNFSSNIVDLSSIHDLLLQHGKKLEIIIKNFTNAFVIDLKDEFETFGSIEVDYEFPMNLEACTNLLINIKNLMHVCYDRRVNTYALYPIPLRMNDNKSVLVLSQDDVEQNMTIRIDRQRPNFICQSYNNSLILTNLIMEEDPKDEFALVFLDYFPQSSNLLDHRNEELFDSIIFDFKGQKENETATVKEYIEKCNFLLEQI